MRHDEIHYFTTPWIQKIKKGHRYVIDFTSTDPTSLQITYYNGFWAYDSRSGKRERKQERWIRKLIYGDIQQQLMAA